MLVILLMILCSWFHIKTGNVYLVGDSIYSTPININKYFRNILENYLNCTGILVTSSLTVQCLEKFKTPQR